MDGKEDQKLRGLIEGGAISADEKPDVAWLTFGAEFLGFKEGNPSKCSTAT